MSQIQNSKILVTGGAGFIGSNLSEKLLQQNNHVIVLDNLLTGKIQNIEDLKSYPQFEFIEGDIRNLEICKQAVSQCDYVFHQAALGSVPRSVEDPATSTEININGTLNVFIAAKDEKVKHIVFASSSSVYGDSKHLPKTEDLLGNPLSPYAVTKRCNEFHAQNFRDLYGLKITGLRYFNVFGPRQDTDSIYAAVIPKFVKAFMTGESPIINGDGSYSRDFTYVENVLHANELAAVTDADELVFNVACGGKTTLLELVQQIQEILAHYNPNIKDIPIQFAPNRAGDIPHSMADISRSVKSLNYQPLYNWEEGLKKACEWYWRNL